MKKYTEHCDLCEKEFYNDKNGFFIEIGYSPGGWGNRNDFTPKRSLEICNNCLKQLEDKATQIDETINKLSRKSIIKSI